jgi:hypothetical protein
MTSLTGTGLKDGGAAAAKLSVAPGNSFKFGISP